MNSYYKFAVLIIRLASVFVVLHQAYALIGFFIFPFILGGVPAFDSLGALILRILTPLAFAMFLWFAAHAIAKIASRGLE